MTQSLELKKLTMSSALVAIAFALELFIKFVLPMFNMPFGGNFIGLSMLPMVIVGFLYGFKYGVIAGFVYGVFEVLLAPSGYIVGWSFLLDYLIGFTAYGLTGLFVGKLKSVKFVVIGVLLAGFVRYLSVSIAGVIFWSETANFDAVVYSFVYYNLGYNLSTTVITLALLILIRKRIILLNDDFLGTHQDLTE
jgi:thiamine transporter